MVSLSWKCRIWPHKYRVSGATAFTPRGRQSYNTNITHVQMGIVCRKTLKELCLFECWATGSVSRQIISDWHLIATIVYGLYLSVQLLSRLQLIVQNLDHQLLSGWSDSIRNSLSLRSTPLDGGCQLLCTTFSSTSHTLEECIFVHCAVIIKRSGFGHPI